MTALDKAEWKDWQTAMRILLRDNTRQRRRGVLATSSGSKITDGNLSKDGNLAKDGNKASGTLEKQRMVITLSVE